jgi:hypothetical protein
MPVRQGLPKMSVISCLVVCPILISGTRDPANSCPTVKQPVNWVEARPLINNNELSLTAFALRLRNSIFMK